ncbi:MAG: InlB B-repeat-containing protein [Clostridium sp.]|nr:InlB B-repeat-containing protein [Clostridium sp.]MCM1207503.1 InlB B-repeat-containing protein [Ruminococcus sp.]
MRKTLMWLLATAVAITSTTPISYGAGSELGDEEYVVEEILEAAEVTEENSEVTEITEESTEVTTAEVTEESAATEVAEENSEVTEVTEENTDVTATEEITEAATEDMVDIVLYDDVQLVSEGNADAGETVTGIIITSLIDWINMKANSELFSGDIYIGNEPLVINMECDTNSSFTQIAGSDAGVVINGNSHVFDVTTDVSSITYNDCQIGSITIDNGTTAVFNNVSFNGLVTIESNAGVVTMDNCTFADIADTGMNIKQQGNGITINNTSFSGTGTGILIEQGTDITLNSCSFSGLEHGMRNDMSAMVSSAGQSTIEFNNCTSEGCGKVYYVEGRAGDNLRVNGGNYAGNGSSVGFEYTIGTTVYDGSYFPVEVHDAIFKDFDAAIKTGYGNHLVSGCTFENNMTAVKTNTGGGDGLSRIENCEITGKNSSDANCYGIDTSGGSRGSAFGNGNTNEDNYGYVVKDTIITNCYNAINMHHAFTVYVDNVTATNVNSGINSGEGSRAQGMAFVCNSHFTAKEDKNDYSYGVAVSNGGGAGYNNSFNGFHVGVSNCVGSSSGHMCWVNTDIINADIGAEMYVSALVGCHVTAKQYGVRGTASFSVYNTLIEGIGDDAVAGICGQVSYGTSANYSELLLGIAFKSGYPAGSNISDIGGLKGIVDEYINLDEKSEISNFRYGVSVDGTTNIFYTSIHDCETGVQVGYWSDNGISRGSGQVQYKDSNEIYNCTIGVNNTSSSGFFVYPITSSRETTNIIYDCDTGLYTSGQVSVNMLPDGLYNLEIYGCDEGFVLDGSRSLYLMSLSCHDNETGFCTKGSSTLNCQGGFLAKDNGTGVKCDEGSTVNVYAPMVFEGNERNVHVEGRLSTQVGDVFSFSKDESYTDADSYLEIGYNSIPIGNPNFPAMFFVGEDAGYYEGKPVIVSMSRTEEFDEGVMTFYREKCKKLEVEVIKDGWIAEAVYQTVTGAKPTATISLAEGIYVTYDWEYNGGTSWDGEQEKVAVRKGEKVDITPTASKAGYEFVGWNTDKDATAGFTVDDDLTAIEDVTGDITLYAIYRKDMSVAYHDCDGVMAEDVVSFYNNETEKDYELLEYSGNTSFEFAGYTLNADNTSNLLDNAIELTLSDNDVEIYSVYKADGLLQYLDTSGNVYYNLEIISCLLGNVYLSRLARNNVMYVCSAVQNEKKVPVYGYYGTRLRDAYVVDIDLGESGFSNDERISEDAGCFNVDNMEVGTNRLTRAFTVKNGTADEQVYVIVDWNYVIPDNEILANEDIANYVSSIEEGTDSLTLQDVNSVIYTRPTGSAILQEWWDSNLSVSNSLANFMYGTSGVEYVKSGYLAPSITILRPEGVTDGTISQIFTQNGFKLDETGLKYCGSTTKWWEVFYSGSTLSDTYTKALAAGTRGYKLLNGKNMADGKTYSDSFFVTRAGVIYENVQTNDSVLYKDGQLNIQTRRVKGSSETPIGKEFNYNGQKWILTGSRRINHEAYYCVQPLFEDSRFTISGVVVDDKLGILPVSNLSSTKPNSAVLNDCITKLNELYADFFGMPMLATSTVGTTNKIQVTDSSFLYEAQPTTVATKFRDVYGKCWYVNNKTLTDGRETKESFTTKKFEKLRGKSIQAIPVFFLKVSDYYFYESQGEYYLNSGALVNALNVNGIYTNGISQAVRDSIIYANTNTVPINNLVEKQVITIADINFVRVASSNKGAPLFVSEPISDTDLISVLNSSATDEDKLTAVKSHLFVGIPVVCGGQQFYLSSFINNAYVGSLYNPDGKSGVLYSGNGKKGGAPVVYLDGTNQAQDASTMTPTSVCITIQLDDGLYVRPTTKKLNRYVALLTSSVTPNTYVDEIPFFRESLVYEEGSAATVAVTSSRFFPSEWFKATKTKYKQMMRDAFKGDVITVLWMFAFYFAVYLAIVSWIMWAILTEGYGRKLFETITLPSKQNSMMRHGFDLIKILTFGIYNIDSEPTLARTFVTSFISFFISYAIVMWRP